MSIPPRDAPSQVFQVPSFRITLPVVLTIGVAVLTYLHATHEAWRKTIEFLGVAAGVAGGLQSAYYIGRTLRDTLEQHDRELTDKKQHATFKCHTRWYGTDLQKQWLELLPNLQSQNAAEVVAAVNADDTTKKTANAVISYFEQVGYAAKVGRVDTIHLSELMGTAIQRNFGTLQPWINEYRRRNNQPTLAEHFEWLARELERR